MLGFFIWKKICNKNWLIIYLVVGEAIAIAQSYVTGFAIVEHSDDLSNRPMFTIMTCLNLLFSVNLVNHQHLKEITFRMVWFHSSLRHYL